MLGELLVEQRASVNCVDKHSRSALFDAVRKGNLGCANLLVANRADLNLVDSEGRTVLHEAAHMGNADLYTRCTRFRSSCVRNAIPGIVFCEC